MVREHINSFLREVRHYCRTQTGTEKEYLSSDLNIYKLYRAFQMKYPDTTISHRYYYRVFVKDFPNLSFKQPRMDTCKTCDLLNLNSKIINEEGRKAKVELELHHRKTEAAFKAIKDEFRGSTMPGSDNCTVTYGMMLLPTRFSKSYFFLPGYDINGFYADFVVTTNALNTTLKKRK